VWLVALKSRRPGRSSERCSQCSWRSKVWLTHYADSGIFVSPCLECEHAAAHTVVCEHDYGVFVSCQPHLVPHKGRGDARCGRNGLPLLQIR
jgi:hypothetical protein